MVARNSTCPEVWADSGPDLSPALRPAVLRVTLAGRAPLLIYEKEPEAREISGGQEIMCTGVGDPTQHFLLHSKAFPQPTQTWQAGEGG